MTLYWFLSGTVRQATDLHKHVRKLLNSQRDLLPPPGIGAVEKELAHLQAGIDAKADKKELQERMTTLEKVATQWLKPYPHSEWRENIEVMLVAIAVAMAIRTFFLQPFKIPTGSMQPTLWGIDQDNLRERPDAQIPGYFGRVYDATVHGVFYHQLKAKDDCVVVDLRPAASILRFINRQTLRLRYADGHEESEVLWLTPDEHFEQKSELAAGQAFRKGEYIVKVRETVGDHLFVNRLTYNFRRPRRGEIIVFETKGIPTIRQDQFYIKRLVALGGETVRIGDDRHVVINGTRLDAATPHFENVYTLGPEPLKDHYSGHVNGVSWSRDPMLTPFFPNGQAEFQVRPEHYLAMGDNTTYSLDSRNWGDFPQQNVIGKFFFVYWPISNHGTSRFGWAVR